MAKEFGVADIDLERFLDEEITREGFIVLVMEKMRPDPRDELRAMSKRELRIKAETLGVAATDIEEFRFDEISTELFVELVARKIEARQNLDVLLGQTSRQWTNPFLNLAITLMCHRCRAQLDRFGVVRSQFHGRKPYFACKAGPAPV